MKSDHQTANEDIAKLESLWKAALEDSKKFQNESQSWKDKYYNAIQELISIKSDLEESMLKLSFTDHKIDDLDRVLDREF